MKNDKKPFRLFVVLLVGLLLVAISVVLNLISYSPETGNIVISIGQSSLNDGWVKLFILKLGAGLLAVYIWYWLIIRALLHIRTHELEIDGSKNPQWIAWQMALMVSSAFIFAIVVGS